MTILPVSAIAGPKEDAFKVIEQFKMAFDSAGVPGVVKLFAPDAVFLGTVSPKLATKTAEIDTVPSSSDQRRPGLEHQTFPIALAAGTMTLYNCYPVQATIMACIRRDPNPSWRTGPARRHR